VASVYILVFHDPWDLSDAGPEDVSISGVYATRALAEGAAIAPVLDDDRDYSVDDSTDSYYTVVEERVQGALDPAVMEANEAAWYGD